ncbi:MAG: hypothetical protein B7Y99_09245 [Caulobacterales bacterium 32-69-10]|nr:MAG: hypothetical protein B7Y99_09245 [Caulobacterales bacterium 32-69-10]
MTFRNLLVHVDTSSEGRSRLVNATHLARKLDARLIGVGAVAYEPYPDRTGMSERYAREWISETLTECEALFGELAADLNDTAWRTQVGRPASTLCDFACGADLIIGSRAAESEVPLIFARPDDVLLSAGTPVLLQPPAAAPLEAARIIFGWKNTRECRRAVSDSLPLLAAAEEVKLLRFVSEGHADDDDGLDDVAERLRRHGVALTVERRQRHARSVGEDMIEAATAVGADLIVAGAYGQPRVRELILGGVTRSLLAHSPMYVLFSH